MSNSDNDSDNDLKQEMLEESDNFFKLQKKINDNQINNFFKLKENLKNVKQMVNRIQEKNSKNENEIKELKQNLQQLIENKKEEEDVKNKTDLIENKNQSLEKEMESLKNIMNEKFQKLKSDHEKEIEELKQTFQQIIDEKFKQIKIENDNNLQQIINQKDKKINSLEEQIKKLNAPVDKKSELTNVNFEHFKNNKWKEIVKEWNCCENNCINTNKTIGNCIKRNGFVNVSRGVSIFYKKCVDEEGLNKPARILSEFNFKKPKRIFYCIKYSLHYFEIKCKFEGEKDNWMNIGVKNSVIAVRFEAETSSIGFEHEGKDKNSKLPQTFSWNDDDIFGCGLVYPPTNKMPEEFPYVFFTQNGKQIGKAVLLKENFEYFTPYIILKCCSALEII